MIIEISKQGANSVTFSLVDAGNLRALSVAASGIERADLSPLLEALNVGHADDSHAWLSIPALAGLGRLAVGPDDTEWSSGFDNMIKYAASQSWVSDDGAFVRAHCEWR